MTPPASTSAARRKSVKPEPLRAPEVAPVPRRRREQADEIRITRRSTSSRRISGPVAGRGAAAAAVAQPLVRPERRPGSTGTERILRAVGGAPDHRLTISLISSRAWIPLLAVGALVIVFMQVHLMNVNRGIGVDVQRVSQLQLQNSELKAEVSGLSSDQRVVAEAQRLGFVEPPVGTSRFTKATATDSTRALSTMTAATSPGLQQLAGRQSSSSGSNTGSTSSDGTNSSASSSGAGVGNNG